MNNEERASLVYETVCHVLDDEGIIYQKYDEMRSVDFIYRGIGMPLKISIISDAVSCRLMLIMTVPVNVEKRKNVDMNIALCAINDTLIDGSYKFNMSSGELKFKMTSSFKGSSLDEGVVKYLIAYAIQATAVHNEILNLLGAGIILVDRVFEEL